MWGAFWKRITQKRNQMSPIIAFNETGIEIKIGEDLKNISWKSIRKITAFKRDLITTDMICLLLELSDKTNYELNEETEGFKEGLKSLEIHLGISPEWFLKIMTPAFESSVTVIYEQPAQI
jgi:hypothetical protein